MPASRRWRCDDPAKQEFLIAIAKTRVGDAATLASEIAHQVHGAIGFTKEYALQLSTRRLWSWRDEFGGDTGMGGTGRRLCVRRGADALWPGPCRQTVSPLHRMHNDHPQIDAREASLVDTGGIITGGGVTLCIDTMLHVLERHFGAAMARETARSIEYHRAWAANLADLPPFVVRHPLEQ